MVSASAQGRPVIRSAWRTGQSPKHQSPEARLPRRELNRHNGRVPPMATSNRSPGKTIPTRLRVVQGDAQHPKRKTLSAFQCTACTERPGVVAHTLVQVLRTPHEANGKLVAGSLWWACG